METYKLRYFYLILYNQHEILLSQFSFSLIMLELQMLSY